MAYPCYAYDALNRCIFEENHSLGCHFMNAGCPSPTRTCANLFKPTPPTGKHPCDLSPPAETTESITSATPTVMPTITAVPRAA
ncbi:hypothetical protein K458DRAFT_423346 [Lentithecium fluviatile CBS 122367]|uniref:Uncharacterized protein n=1 Tax=Lentithecium fluviatile CBS 122367 TaxID=1168545 RepID=A0A6G1IJJ6_9PLEO|nr:hypothetical protein K458DRAFT_423346 [Lentithecium fluviatile CBS 122367]